MSKTRAGSQIPWYAVAVSCDSCHETLCGAFVTARGQGKHYYVMARTGWCWLGHPCKEGVVVEVFLLGRNDVEELEGKGATPDGIRWMMRSIMTQYEEAVGYYTRKAISTDTMFNIGIDIMRIGSWAHENGVNLSELDDDDLLNETACILQDINLRRKRFQAVHRVLEDGSHG